jgi:transposase
VSKVVKRAFKFRFYPTDGQAAELARTFGCVRKVYNLALAARTEAWTLRQERVNYNTTSAMLTGWKKTEDLAFLNEVSSVPLQQTLRHLQVAFTTSSPHGPATRGSRPRSVPTGRPSTPPARSAGATASSPWPR